MDNAKIEETEKDLVLVTGATGFIAMHIVKILLEKGYKVKGTVRNLKEEKKIQILKRLVPNSVGDLEFVEADLTKEDGWVEAVKGCKYVLHTASPFPVEIPKNEEDLIKPAFKGTLILLRACVENDSKVKRVVLTGSCSSMFGDKFIENHVYTEKDWPYFRKLYPYSKSKHLAEKAAWDFVKERTDKHLPCFELAVVNPGYVLVITNCVIFTVILKLGDSNLSENFKNFHKQCYY
jgi:dihydroflavonol-4-reductase